MAIKPEQFVEGFIRQSPYDGNCLSVAIANALIDDGVFDFEKAKKFIDYIDDTYNVKNKGSTPFLYGPALYELGYDCHFINQIYDVGGIKGLMAKGKVIRSFFVDCAFPRTCGYTDEYIHWVQKFVEKYKAENDNNKKMNEHSGMHAVYVRKFFNEGSDIFNPVGYYGVNDMHGWFTILNNPTYERQVRNAIVSHDNCIFLEKR